MSRVVKAISRAPRIEVYGVGASGLAAVDASAKLRRVGLPAWSHPDAHQQAQSASLLGSRCVVLAFSHSGATRDVLTAATLAQEAGAMVVGLTSFPLSPLAQMADEVLLTGAASEPTERSGSTLTRIAQLYIADVLTVCYSLSRPAQSRDALRRTSEAVEDRRVPAPGTSGRSDR
jgi:DNA-binding MurR/RpiR family transcriptional regulator